MESLFDAVDSSCLQHNELRIFKLRNEYLATIDPVMAFLQHKNPTLAYSIVADDWLPRASRFDQLDDLEWAFGNLGVQDKARHLATLYLEDLADFIKNTLDPYFGFSRYAERLSLSIDSFDPLHQALIGDNTFTDEVLKSCLTNSLETSQPDLVCISVPFPGNLYGALKCGQLIRQHDPKIKIALGGGYVNTELRSLKDVRIFEFVDFIALDDGERPIELLLDYLDRKIDQSQLKRTYVLEEGHIRYINGSKKADVSFGSTGTPDYSGLPISSYLSVIEMANPMHRLWSDGRWNKLTMAHGCYWKKCTFCDISLDYIKNYEPISASIICDRMEELIVQTGETGFHFVDEAAPPALMKEVALEIIHRNLKVSWWTNIRFEKSFTQDLCRLLKQSGCIAVSGGLEVASDRLLAMIKKGVTVAQVARVANHFTQSGIMVHAYLMYGFPTQTDQETIDSLEMVRQLFEYGAIQSGFWHQFAMTAHSPVGLAPETFGVKSLLVKEPIFAHNDLPHEDPSGADHTMYSDGLKASLFNYMHGVGFDFHLQDWFDFDVPETSISPHQIEMDIQLVQDTKLTDSVRIVWLNAIPDFEFYTKKQKGKAIEKCRLVIQSKSEALTIVVDSDTGRWLQYLFETLEKSKIGAYRLGDLQQNFETSQTGPFNKFLKSQTWKELKNAGMLMV